MERSWENTIFPNHSISLQYESQAKLGFPVLAMRDLTLFLESPTFSRVSIEPRMEAAAPDLTETRRGGEPPKTFQLHLQ